LYIIYKYIYFYKKTQTIYSSWAFYIYILNLGVIKIKRKVIQIANSTMLVSLPRAWVIKNNVKKGDEIDIQEKGKSIVVSPETTAPEILKADVNITSMDRTSIMNLIRSLYRLGYDEIRLHFDKEFAYHYRTKKEMKVSTTIHTEVNRLTGYEVVQQKENLVIIKDLLEISQKEFDTAMRRVFMLFVDTTKDLYLGLKDDNKSIIESIEEKNDTMIKFISYCLRILNKIGYNSTKKTTIYYHTIASLDIVNDIMKYIARDYLAINKKLCKESINIFKNLVDALATFHEYFYKFSSTKLVEFMERRDIIKKGIRALPKSSQQSDFILVNAVEQILEITKDLVEGRIGIEYCED
jgi:phosphate uptake regulator